jgi:hypothetical protein
MSYQHLSCDLCVARLICAYQTEVGKSKEEKKSAKTSKKKPVCNSARVRRCQLVFDVNCPGFGFAKVATTMQTSPAAKRIR